jgi:hypothetical protein
MTQERLDIAFWNYDRVQALANGTIAIEGVDARFHTSPIVTEIFEGMIRKRAYDVSELGVTYLLRTFDRENADWLALPVFLNRAFRHSAIYVNKGRGIEHPRDLAGKRIGELALYGHDSGVMSKGILSDDFEFEPSKARWLIGAIDFPMEPIDFVAHPHPRNVEVEWASKDVDLGRLLESGEIDALFSADVPRCVLDGAPNVGRLFEEFVPVERDYFTRTGVFPIMHTVAVRRDLAEKRPDLIKAVYDAFCQSRDAAIHELKQGMTFNNMAVMAPWMTDLMSKNLDVLGADWWPYGISHNRAALEAILRYHHEQGLTTRRYAIAEIFVPYLLNT